MKWNKMVLKLNIKVATDFCPYKSFSNTQFQTVNN